MLVAVSVSVPAPNGRAAVAAHRRRRNGDVAPASGHGQGLGGRHRNQVVDRLEVRAVVGDAAESVEPLVLQAVLTVKAAAPELSDAGDGDAVIVIRSRIR